MLSAFRGCNLDLRRVLVANRPFAEVRGACPVVEVDDAGTIGALVDALERKAGVEPGKLGSSLAVKRSSRRRDGTLVSAKIGPTTRLVVSRVGRTPRWRRRPRAQRESAARAPRPHRARRSPSPAHRGQAKAHVGDRDAGGMSLPGLIASRSARPRPAPERPPPRGRGRLARRFGRSGGGEALRSRTRASPSASTTRPSSLDVAWAMFQLRDPTASRAVEDSSGAVKASRGRTAQTPRLRALHGGFQPELGLYVRLEAVAAFHDGVVAAARVARVGKGAPRPPPRSDDALASLLAMGFEEKGHEALRFAAGTRRPRPRCRTEGAATPRRSAPRGSGRLTPGRRRYGLRPPAARRRGRWKRCVGWDTRVLSRRRAARDGKRGADGPGRALAMARDALEEDAAATEAENAQRKAAGARATDEGGPGAGRGGGGGGGDADAPLTGDAAIASDPAGDAGERDGSSSGDDDSGSGGSSTRGPVGVWATTEEGLTDSLTGDGPQYDVDLDAESRPSTNTSRKSRVSMTRTRVGASGR